MFGENVDRLTFHFNIKKSTFGFVTTGLTLYKTQEQHYITYHIYDQRV